MRFLVMGAALILTACGGGGGGGPPTPTPMAYSYVTNQVTSNNIVTNYAVGDLNGDGLDDVVIGGWSNQDISNSNLAILIQNSDGTLTDKTIELVGNNQYPGSNNISIGDFDHDGFKDIWLPGYNDCNGCTAQSVILWGSASGKFTRQTFDVKVSSHGSCQADMNGDGFEDLLIRGVWDPSINNYGYYLNNGNRTFTFVPAHYAHGSQTCAVIKDTNTHHYAIVQGSNVTDAPPGYISSINILDNNLNLIKQIGVASQDTNTNDLVGSITVDVNGDGLLDFVLVFNALASGAPGRKEVWLNRGNDNFTYEYTIDNAYNNQYDIQSIEYQGNKLYFFNAPNGDAILYRLFNGQFEPYKRDSFLSMATALGGHVGVKDWSIRFATVYRGSAGLYMFQDIKQKYYTQKL